MYQKFCYLESNIIFHCETKKKKSESGIYLWCDLISGLEELLSLHTYTYLGS